MARKLQAIIIASLLAFTCAKVVPVISEQYETCVSPENSAGKYDTSGVELIALSDTDLFVNGSLKILKEVKSPFSGKVFAERFDRGAWSLELFNRNYNDFCTTFVNPLEPSYVFTSKMEPKACPFPANVRLYMRPKISYSAFNRFSPKSSSTWFKFGMTRWISRVPSWESGESHLMGLMATRKEKWSATDSTSIYLMMLEKR